MQIVDTLNKPTLRAVFKEHGNIGFSTLQILTKRFVDGFGFSTKLSDAQIEMITIDASDAFKYESLQDVILFFKMARSGKFGTTNRGLDSNLIFGTWLPMYLEQKAQAREEEYKKNKDQMNSEPLSYDSVQKFYKKHKDSKKNQENLEYAKRRIDEITKDFDKQMLEDTITDWESKEEFKPWVFLLKKKRKTIK